MTVQQLDNLKVGDFVILKFNNRSFGKFPRKVISLGKGYGIHKGLPSWKSYDCSRVRSVGLKAIRPTWCGFGGQRFSAKKRTKTTYSRHQILRYFNIASLSKNN